MCETRHYYDSAVRGHLGARPRCSAPRSVFAIRHKLPHLILAAVVSVMFPAHAAAQQVRVKERLRLGEQPGKVRSIAYAPGGTLLASAGDDGIVRLWNATQNRPVTELRGP